MAFGCPDSDDDFIVVDGGDDPTLLLPGGTMFTIRSSGTTGVGRLMVWVHGVKAMAAWDCMQLMSPFAAEAATTITSFCEWLAASLTESYAVSAITDVSCDVLSVSLALFRVPQACCMSLIVYGLA